MSMGERRFVIYDATDGAKFEPDVVTLSELQRRIGCLRYEVIRAIPDYNKCIDILLHGEAKEPEKITYERPCGATVKVPSKTPSFTPSPKNIGPSMTEAKEKDTDPKDWKSPYATTADCNEKLSWHFKKEPEMPPLRGMTIDEIKRNYPEEFALAFGEEPPTDAWEEWCDRIETAIVTRNKIRETFREMPR